MSINIDIQREVDIQKICNGILEITPDYYDNPNGEYETTCPFCYVTEYRGSSIKGKSIWANMKELAHKLDCIYLIAKDLSTKK